MGDQALQGVQQPDARPTKKKTGKQIAQDGVPILSEKDILTKVAEQEKKLNQRQQSEEKVQAKESEAKESEEKEEAIRKADRFPSKSQDRGVTLEVESVEEKGGSLLLAVKLQNEGGRPVRFLYSFLDVTDDRGRGMSAVTEGLPGEVPANGQTFSGTVSIPKALLEESKQLSLSLTDYPEQKLELKVSGIPVE